ncbi:MAG: diguanylate cyclase and metal dependent phosphohydrolase [Acidobacteria bacterium]|jgi:putative nucleotidyltransferase with HDIG domain|nr:diguanylate cyclase and metal dependent phosphohydrolase [Acidobacteriota bacterium]
MATSSKPLSPLGRAYVGAVIATGGTVVAYAAQRVIQAPPDPMWFLLLALTTLSSMFAIRIPNVSASISVSETFVFVCALLYGPAPATLVIAVDGLVISCWRRHRPVHQVLFNLTEPALSLFVASSLFFTVSGISVSDRAPLDVGSNLVPLVLFVSTYFVINSGLTSIVVSIHQAAPLWSIWRQHFGWVLLNYFGAASVAALLVHNSRDFNFVALGAVVPLMMISYLTFKTSLARVEDANRHLQELNRLYLSTIETLAMAVDAKDQITHGHIRRVQAMCVGLARAIGVKDERQLKAIEAAALLHDMGKLAIPEHILNKPGKLSPAEFDKMKKHATIGADILSAIDFPYPVVPIVRHHHERWDGRGYPDGIAGADIPIGARILSVVDVFDALTSDRPYRRALSEEQALGMLIEDRGRAYDPLVVDTFAQVYRDIAPREIDFGPHRRAIEEIASVTKVDHAAPTEPSGPGDVDPHLTPIYESLHAFSGQAVLSDAAEELARKLNTLTPSTLCALFVYDQQSGELALVHASGASANHLRGARIPLGERLSGWVAANRRTICNSDAALDLAELPDPPRERLQSCLSTPLVAGDGLVGVLSLYATDLQAFSEQHRRLIEQLARPLAHLVRGAIELEKVQDATGAVALAALPPIREAGDAMASGTLFPVAAVSLRVVGLPADGDEPDSVSERLLARAAAVLHRDLRVADILYRDGVDGLLALLPHADTRAAATIADRARDSLLAALYTLDTDKTSGVQVVTGIGTSPTDGPDIDAVMAAARARANTNASAPPTSRRSPLASSVTAATGGTQWREAS